MTDARRIIADAIAWTRAANVGSERGADNAIAALARSGFHIVATPAVGEVSEEARVAGAKVLAHTLRMAWEGLYPGKIEGYPAWKVGGHYNAHQGDYCDLAENIFNAMLPFVLDRAALASTQRKE